MLFFMGDVLTHDLERFRGSTLMLVESQEDWRPTGQGNERMEGVASDVQASCTEPTGNCDGDSVCGIDGD